MALTNRGTLTLKGASSTGPGDAIHLGWLTRQQVSFAVTFPGGTTSVSVRAQVKGPGPGATWTNIGSAASTIGSSQAGTAFNATSATPFAWARLNLVSLTTSTAAAGVSGWIAGAA